MAKRWKCARCGTKNDEPTLTCSNCRMIRGAVVVKPQAPATGSWTTPTAISSPRPEALQPDAAPPDAWSIPRDQSSPPPNQWSLPPNQWVLPENDSRKPRFALPLLLSAAVFVVGFAIAILNASPVAPEDATDTTEGALAAFELRVGECFDLQETESGTITDVTRRPCDREHQYELFLTGTLTGIGYPTQSDFDLYFEDECVPEFLEYVGAPYESSVLDIYWIVPSREAWLEGDHTIQCAVYHPDIPRLTAPLKGVGPGGGWIGPSA